MKNIDTSINSTVIAERISLYRTGGRYQGKRYQSDYPSGGM